LLDPENDDGWTITSGGTLAEITDTDFPPKQTPAVALAYGGAILDGSLYVLGEDGTIYGSDIEDATAWNALNLISAERVPDGGVYIGKHHDHVFVLGPRSCEFFYDAANATGSPLARRQDVFFDIGCMSGESAWENGDISYFVGTDSASAIGVYALKNFSVVKISNSTIDSFISQAIVKDGYSVVGSGLSAQGHVFYLMTLYTTSVSVIVPETTLCFDSVTGKWGVWETTVNGMTKFPIIAWTTRTAPTPRYGEGIFSNGDLFTLTDDLSPSDTLLASTYVVTDYVDTGYITETAASGTAITLKSRTGQYDGGTHNIKLLSNIRHVGELTDASQTLTVRWSNESSRDFNSGIDVDTSIFQKVNRLGKFRRRNFEVEYSGTEQIKLYALEGDITASDK
jgi:hypothetical protein